MSLGLARRRIAVPERRELDVFAQMLERHGANVIRCPLVAIRDVPDPAPVVAWLQRFTSNFPDDFVLLTGSALRAAPAWRRFSLPRLLGCARSHAARNQYDDCEHWGCRPISPQSHPQLRELSRCFQMSSSLGARVGIQLYPDNPNLELLDFLHAAGANPDPVLCYLYGSEAEDQRVIELIDEMAAGRVDLIASPVHHRSSACGG